MKLFEVRVHPGGGAGVTQEREQRGAARLRVLEAHAHDVPLQRRPGQGFASGSVGGEALQEQAWPVGAD